MEQTVLTFIDQLNSIRSTVAKYHNATVQGDDPITGAEVRELIENLKTLESQCTPESLSLEEIDAIKVDDPTAESTAA